MVGFVVALQPRERTLERECERRENFREGENFRERQTEAFICCLRCTSV